MESKTLLTHHPPSPLPLRNMSKNSFVLVGLPFPIFKRPVVFICCRTVSLHQAGDLTCWIAIFQIFQIWGGKWLKCRQCSLFSDKGLATTGLRNNVWGGRRASQVNDTCCCWYKVAVILSFEVETLYLTAGIIIFDTLVPRAFQKYTTCMVFKAVQLFKKSATWFSENEGGGSKAVWNFSKNSSVLVGGGFPKGRVQKERTLK